MIDTLELVNNNGRITGKMRNSGVYLYPNYRLIMSSLILDNEEGSLNVTSKLMASECCGIPLMNVRDQFLLGLKVRLICTLRHNLRRI